MPPNLIPSTILSEHQAPHSPDPKPGYNPSESEQSTVRMVEKLFSEAKKAKERKESKWLENYKFFKGKQWQDKRPSYRHSEVINYIFSEIQTVLVILTDNRPKIDVYPEDPTDYEFAKILSEVISSKWENDLFSSVVASAIIDSSIYGTAIAKVPWDKELADGLGDFDFITTDPFTFFPDPNAHEKINDKLCNYVIEAEPVDVRTLKADYPDKADFITADLQDLTNAYLDKDEQEEIRMKSPTDNRVRIESGRGVQGGKPNQALKICAYLKSDEMFDKELEGPLDETGTATKLYQSMKKYPNGRKIVIANGVLLEDGPNEYYNGKYPYARLVDHQMPREFWGIGEVEQLKSPQVIVNKLLSHILDVITIMGNPIWVVGTDSGIETDNLTNQPGLVVEKNPGSEARRESGLGLQGGILEVLQFVSERVLGKLGSTSDVSRGVAPYGNASGYAIAQLQEAAQTKLRGKSRNLENFLKDVGDLMVDRILQYYKLPRIVRLTSNQEASRFFEFYVSEVADEQGEIKKLAQISEYSFDPASNNYVKAAPKTIELKSRLDVRIGIGSSLPFAKIENRTLSEKLFDKGVIDAEEYLTQIEYPGKERIIEKLNKAAAAKQAMPPQGDPNATGQNAANGTASPTGQG